MKPPTSVAGGWRKSSRCSNHQACVFVQRGRPDGLVGVRDANGTPPLALPVVAWRDFVAAIKTDEFDAR